MDFETTTYSHDTDHEAIYVRWGHAESHLGHPHAGTPEDDDAIVEQLLLDGAPDWIRDAEGWIDEDGWGLIGPEIDD